MHQFGGPGWLPGLRPGRWFWSFFLALVCGLTLGSVLFLILSPVGARSPLGLILEILVTWACALPLVLAHWLLVPQPVNLAVGSNGLTLVRWYPLPRGTSVSPTYEWEEVHLVGRRLYLPRMSLAFPTRLLLTHDQAAKLSQWSVRMRSEMRHPA